MLDNRIKFDTCRNPTYKTYQMKRILSLTLIFLTMATTISAQELNSPWPIGNPNDAYAQYFTGQSYLASITPKNLQSDSSPRGGQVGATVQSYANVTFEAGCRNNWHVHHGAHQILICVSGEGIYQEWGKPAIRLHAGDIIDIPECAKH